MPAFPQHTFTIDISAQKSFQLIEKITGEFGKLVRDDFNVKPFTGTVKEKKFTIMPNIPNTAVKLKGTIESEGMNKTRITVNGTHSFGKFLIYSLILVAGMPLVSLFIFFSYENGDFIPASLGVSLLLGLILTTVLFSAAKFPKSQYNQAVHELMRKLDNHELVL